MATGADWDNPLPTCLFRSASLCQHRALTLGSWLLVPWYQPGEAKEASKNSPHDFSVFLPTESGGFSFLLNPQKSQQREKTSVRRWEAPSLPYPTPGGQNPPPWGGSLCSLPLFLCLFQKCDNPNHSHTIKPSIIVTSSQEPSLLALAFINFSLFNYSTLFFPLVLSSLAFLYVFFKICIV